MHSIPVLSSTTHLKVVVYFRETRFVPFFGICSVMKISHYKYSDCCLLVKKLIQKAIMKYHISSLSSAAF